MKRQNIKVEQSNVTQQLEKHEQIIAYSLVATGIVFYLILFSGQITHPTIPRNNFIYHWNLIRKMLASWESGANPIDFWVSTWSGGFPIFRYYQFLPHLVVTGTYLILGKLVPLFYIYNGYQYFLLSMFPLSVFIGLRWIGFRPIAAAGASIAAGLISCEPEALRGFDFESYIYPGGYGHFAQLFAMFFLPLSLGGIYGFLQNGRFFIPAFYLTICCCLSHILFGYILAISSIFIALLVHGESGIRRTLLRLLVFGLATFSALSFFIIPISLEHSDVNRTIMARDWWWDSYGFLRIIKWLFSGVLLDGSRIPVLTLLALCGLIWALIKRNKSSKIAVLIFVLWLLLYMGRSAWGNIINILPFSHVILFHRFINGVHMGAILLFASGFAFLAKQVQIDSSKIRMELCSIIIIIILLPPLVERLRMMGYFQRVREEYQLAVQRDTNRRAALDYLEGKLNGRIYPGFADNWGGQFPFYAPMFAFISYRGLDEMGLLYTTLSPNADFQVLFNQDRAAHYRLYNVDKVIAPESVTLREDIIKIEETFGPYCVYSAPGKGWFDLVRVKGAIIGKAEKRYKHIRSWLEGEWTENKIYFAVLNAADAKSKWINLINAEDASATLPDPKKWKDINLGKVLSEKREDNQFIAEVQVDTPCTLLFKMTYHPGWEILIDGKQQSAFMITPAFTGIPLSKGRHRIVCQYRSGLLKSILTVISIVMLLIMPLAYYLMHHKMRWHL
ncbi:YfhO family protein [Candidatus Sumerlaeota bacterium]